MDQGDTVVVVSKSKSAYFAAVGDVGVIMEMGDLLCHVEFESLSGLPHPTPEGPIWQWGVPVKDLKVVDPVELESVEW